jgi:hypothetical protein
MRETALRIAAASRSRVQPNQQGLLDAPAASHSRPPQMLLGTPPAAEKRGFRLAAAAARASSSAKCCPLSANRGWNRFHRARITALKLLVQPESKLWLSWRLDDDGRRWKYHTCAPKALQKVSEAGFLASIGFHIWPSMDDPGIQI